MPDTPTVAVLINPLRKEQAEDLLARLSAEDVPHHVIDVPDADDLAGVAADASADHDVVAAVGGDGTQRTVGATLAGTGTALAVVPGGTVNLLGQVLGIHDVGDAVAAITGGHRRALDVGEVDGDPFLLFAGSGYDARVIEEVDEGAKRFGLLSYAVIGLRELRRGRPRDVVVAVDGAPAWRGRAMGVVVSNVSQRGSGDVHVAPDARPDDGVLDVVIQRCDTLPSVVRAGSRIVRGARPDMRDVQYLRGRHVVVAWSGPVACQRDGDPIDRRARAVHEVRDQQLLVCAPAADATAS